MEETLGLGAMETTNSLSLFSPSCIPRRMLQDVASPSLGWTKEWKFEFELGLEGDQALEWTHFITQLKHSAIRFIDQEDELTWTRSPTTSILTTKVGYKAKMEETRQSIKD